MKPINTSAMRHPLQRVKVKMGQVSALLLCILYATVVRAETVLLSDTTLVSGNESAVFSFNAPGPGTVSVQLTNLDWPQALSSLSFVASTAKDVLASWSDPPSQPDLGPQGLSFQVAGRGTYFADVMASAGGPLDLGVYSFALTFAPAGAPVPLPAGGWLLLAGIMTLIGSHLATRSRSAAHMSATAGATP